MKEHYDVIIVGTGAAGLYCALNLPEKMKILLITKQEADQSDSFLAQGGICMLRGEDDYENYFEDTMRAGHYENNKRAVDLMIRSSNDIIRDLLRYHVDFARDGLGNLAFTREGAHSQPRILFHEDITGKEITQTLLTAAKIKENIEICEYMTMVDLISKDNTVCGIIAMDRNDQAFPVYSQYVVLACGGIGGLFKNSTNFSHIAGDGVGIAMKHHVEMENLDYIQIHPTTLYSKKPGRRFLVSESVRGEGALLYDKNGQRFTNELQPRDLLSQKIFAQMEKDGTAFVTPSFMDYESVYLPKNHFIKEESMETEDYLALFYPFEHLDVVKQGVESSWSVSSDRTMVALTMTFADEPMAKTMSFQREYAEAYDWVAQQFKDWAFTLTTSILYYNDYDLIDEDTRNLYRKGMAAFGGIAPSYHIELLDKPTIYWDFHSLLLGVQMMFSFLLVDGEKPLRLCKHCQKVFLSSRSNSAFCSPRCKNQYNVYKSRGKNKGQEGEEND